MKYQTFVLLILAITSCNLTFCQEQNQNEAQIGRPFVVTFNTEHLDIFQTGMNDYDIAKNLLRQSLPKVQLYISRLLRRSSDLASMNTSLDSNNYIQPSKGSLPGFDDLVQNYFSVPMNSDLHIFITVDGANGGFRRKSDYSFIQQDITTGTIFVELRLYFRQLMRMARNYQDIQNRLKNLFVQNTLKILLGNPQILQLWRDSNNQPYTAQNMPISLGRIDGNDVRYITTPQAQQVIREYHGCSTIPGIPLVVFEGKFELSSVMFQDEILNLHQADEIDPYLSIFTITLLQSTNMYSYVNTTMTDDYFFGKDAGCNFYADQVCQKTEFNNEYCIFDYSQSSGCDYHGYGASVCNPDDGYFTDCYKELPFVYCKDQLKNINEYAYQRNIAGATPTLEGDSRCFISSLKNEFYYNAEQRKEGACYTFRCVPESNQMIVTVQQTQYQVVYQEIVCSYNGQQVSVPGFIGFFFCPQKIDQFCSFKRQCPSTCIENGYCIKGKCECLPNYSGENCEIYTSPDE